MAISNAVPSTVVSSVVGYDLKKGSFQKTTANLPQSIAILGEGTTAAQSTMPTAGTQITSSAQAAALWGAGSPIHRVACILFPSTGGGTNVPVWVYGQLAAVASVANSQTITITGTATASGTHYLKIAGREVIEGSTYAINIVTGDTPTVIGVKVYDAINNALACPVSATKAAGVVTTLAKWTGLTSQDITIEIDTNNTSLGVSYAVAEVAAGSGTPSVAAALTSFGNVWHTLVINTYGLVSATVTELETFNGTPNLTNPTGRWVPTLFKPFIALSGSVSDDPSATTDAAGRKGQVTIAVCPAPLSLGLPFEAAANVALLFGNQTNDAPHGDILGQAYPDMPLPADGDTPLMNSFTERDRIVKKGCSTVDIVAGVYTMVDFVTTYHPDGETPPQWRWCRNVMIDMNVEFGYRILVQLYQLGKTLANDGDAVTVDNVITPGTWKAQVFNYITDLTARALIADAAFSKASTQVEIDGGNPDRLNTIWSYKRTGVDRVSSNTVKAGFNFG